MEKVVMIPESGCWIFTGSLDTSGYGLIGVGGSGNIAKAHRVMYHKYKGEIPDGMVMRHSCDIPCCVNPNHLDLGTKLENARDREDRGRGVRAGKFLKKDHVEKLFEMRNSGMTYQQISDKTGLSYFHVSAIFSGKRQSSITGIIKGKQNEF
jgi:hypothetical protein